MIKRFGLTLMLFCIFAAQMVVFYQMITGYEGNGSIQYLVLLIVFSVGGALYSTDSKP